MSVTYLRQFPGKRRFQRVSKDDWDAPLPRKDIAGFGHILRLEADVRVYAPDGELVIARKWPSKSYIRNFARTMRNIFGSNVQLVDINANNQTVVLNNTGTTGAGFIAQLLNYGTQFNQNGNPELSGLGMAIGQGVFVANHQRNDLISRVGGIYSSRQNIRTSVQNTSTFTLEVTTGVTNGQATTVNVTEIGMFLFAMTTTQAAPTACPFATLFAHDGIASTPVAAGGVIAPRYTMDFPV